MNARTNKRLPLIAIALVLLAGCEPTGPVTTKGVLTRSATNPPLPPAPPGAAMPSEAPAPEAGRSVSGGGLRKANPFDRTDAVATESPSGLAGAEATPSEPAAAPPASSEPNYSPEPTASSTKPLLRLSVGIALPQTLPDGTQVGVSVDYRLTTGRLNPSAKYVWVIESRQGQTAMEVNLRPQGGNLAGFLPLAIRPEDSPFKAWIDEVSTSGSRVRVSNVESLR